MRHNQFKELFLIIQGVFEYISDSNSGQRRRLLILKDMAHIFLTQPTVLRLLYPCLSWAGMLCLAKLVVDFLVI